MQKALMERQKMILAERQRKDAMLRLLEPAAYERLMNVRISNTELYQQLVNLIISLAQQNRINGKLTEKQLLQILERATVTPETKIEYKHK